MEPALKVSRNGTNIQLSDGLFLELSDADVASGLRCFLFVFRRLISAVWRTVQRRHHACCPRMDNRQVHDTYPSPDAP